VTQVTLNKANEGTGSWKFYTSSVVSYVITLGMLMIETFYS